MPSPEGHRRWPIHGSRCLMPPALNVDRGTVLQSIRPERWRALLVGLAAACAPALVGISVGGRHVGFSSRLHFYSVGFSALVAATAAAGLTIVGARRHDTRTMIVG